ASIFDQAHSLKLKLLRKLPPLHGLPPAPLNTLTRCLRNRVQAMAAYRKPCLLAGWIDSKPKARQHGIADLVPSFRRRFEVIDQLGSEGPTHSPCMTC